MSESKTFWTPGKLGTRYYMSNKTPKRCTLVFMYVTEKISHWCKNLLNNPIFHQGMVSSRKKPYNKIAMIRAPTVLFVQCLQMLHSCYNNNTAPLLHNPYPGTKCLKHVYPAPKKPTLYKHVLKPHAEANLRNLEPADAKIHKFVKPQYHDLLCRWSLVTSRHVCYPRHSAIDQMLLPENFLSFLYFISAISNEGNILNWMNDWWMNEWLVF